MRFLLKYTRRNDIPICVIAIRVLTLGNRAMVATLPPIILVAVDMAAGLDKRFVVIAAAILEWRKLE